MKHCIHHLLLAAVAMRSFVSPAAAEEADGKPNATGKPLKIFILADDLGGGDLGCYNQKFKISTPHPDGLAADGARFTDAHCSPQPARRPAV